MQAHTQERRVQGHRQNSNQRDRRQFQSNRPHGVERKTDRITSHAAGAVIVRTGQDGTVEFLLAPYTMCREGMPDETTLRCIVETQLDFTDGMDPESPTDSLNRGIREEVMNDTEASPRWAFWPKKPIVLARLGDCERRGGRHLKLFRMIILKEGDLRTEPLHEDGSWQGVPSKEIVGAPLWIEASEAIEGLKTSKRVHFEAVTTALWKLVNENEDLPQVARRYGDLVERLFGNSRPVRVHDNELDAVVAYITSFKN